MSIVSPEQLTQLQADADHAHTLADHAAVAVAGLEDALVRDQARVAATKEQLTAARAAAKDAVKHAEQLDADVDAAALPDGVAVLGTAVATTS